MADWVPDITALKGPRYKRIVRALEDDIVAGRLEAGFQLPTHRALAEALGLTTGTVTRAYKEAERRGLVHGHVGRGTFVGPDPAARAGNGQAAPAAPAAEESPARAAGPAARLEPRPVVPSGPPYELGEVVPALGPQPAIWRTVLDGLARTPARLADAAAAGQEVRKAGARWVARGGLAATPGRILPTGGARQGLTAALAALAAPGETVLCPSLIDPALRDAASVLGLSIKALVSDEHGVRPESFELACWSRDGRVLYCMPTLHTPTNAVMPAHRRDELVRIARKYDAYIVEDDRFGPLVAPPEAPLARLAPDRCVYLASMAACLDPALRVGFLVAPQGLADRLTATVRALGAEPPAPSALAAARWEADGHAEDVLAWQREESAARQRMAAEALGADRVEAAEGALQLWLPLPEPMRADDFAARCAEEQVRLATAARFAAGRAPPPHAVRIGLGGAATRRDLATALVVMAEVLDAPPGPRPAVKK